MNARHQPETPHACGACGADNPPPAKFCRRCGAPQGGPSVRSVTPLTPLLHRWRRLKATLTRKEVRRLLGEPLRVEPPDPANGRGAEQWTFEYEAVGGTPADRPLRVSGVVEFAPEGRLISWVEPDWEALSPRQDS